MILKTSSNVVKSSFSFSDSSKRGDLLISAATAISSSSGSTATPSTSSAAPSPTTTVPTRRPISCSCGASPQPVNNDLKELRRTFSDSQLDQYLLPSPDSASSSFSSFCCDTPTCHHRRAAVSPAKNQFPFHFPGFPDLPTTVGSNDTTPCLSVYSADDELAGSETCLVRTVTIGDSINIDACSLGSIVEEEGEGEPEEEEDGEDIDENHKGFVLLDRHQQPLPPRINSPPMYLATGLGAADVINPIDLIANSEVDLEVYYRSMIDQFPSHPLVVEFCILQLDTLGLQHLV